MKKLLLGLVAAMFVQVTAMAVGYSVSCGTSGAMIVPSSAVVSAAAWSTNTAYAQGSYALSSNKVYWAVNSGTSGAVATAPGHTIGTKTGSDSIEWLRIDSRNPWKNIWISGDMSVDVTLEIGSAAVAGKGYVLDGARSRVHMPEGMVDAIYGDVASGTATLRVTLFR